MRITPLSLTGAMAFYGAIFAIAGCQRNDVPQDTRAPQFIGAPMVQVADETPQRGLFKTCDGNRAVYLYMDGNGAAVSVVDNAKECPQVSPLALH